LQSFNDALVAKPDDAQAITLQHEATGLGHLQKAKTLASTGDYVSADKELAMALESVPNNGEIKDLITEYKQREPEQIERERLERLARPKNVFDAFLAKNPDAQLFENHVLTTGKPVKDVDEAIVRALQLVQPGFKITGNSTPQPETYAIYANQYDTGILSNTGYRQCLIVCGQASDNETQIYFEDMEYKANHNVSMQGLLAFRDDQSYTPIHPSRIPVMTDKLRAQIQIGVSNLTVRIQGAIGQPPTGQPAVPQ
jgi:hypothetical protein